MIISASRFVPKRLKGPRKPSARRKQRIHRSPQPHKEHPHSGVYEIAEVFSIDDDEHNSNDTLIDHVLRRGSIKGRRL